MSWVLLEIASEASRDRALVPGVSRGLAEEIFFCLRHGGSVPSGDLGLDLLVAAPPFSAWKTGSPEGLSMDTPSLLPACQEDPTNRAPTLTPALSPQRWFLSEGASALGLEQPLLTPLDPLRRMELLPRRQVPSPSQFCHTEEVFVLFPKRRFPPTVPGQSPTNQANPLLS